MMSNQHLKDKRLTLKAKGLMSVMLSLPENWDYTLRGLSAISKEGVDAISEAIKELERSGYVIRNRKRDERGRLSGTEYLIYEDCHMNSQPAQNAPEPEKPKQENPRLENPVQEKPVQENPKQEKPEQENPAQLNTNRSNTNSEKTYLTEQCMFWRLLCWIRNGTVVSRKATKTGRKCSRFLQTIHILLFRR